MNVLIATLLCVSTFGTMVSAQGGPSSMPDDLHVVQVSVDEGEENHVAVTIDYEWNYPAHMFRGEYDTDDDGTVDADEVEAYDLEQAEMTLEDYQVTHRSHVWDVNFVSEDGNPMVGSGSAWDFTAATEGLAGATDADGETVTIDVTISLSMDTATISTEDLTMTMGPLQGDGDGSSQGDGETILPPWNTSVTLNNAAWCTDGADNDGNPLGTDFAYRSSDEFTVTIVYGTECEDATQKEDDDKDGVGNANDQCPGTADGVVVDETGCPVDTGCEEGTDTDGDDVDDCHDTCADTADGDEVDDSGCSESQLPDDPDDDPVTFNVTFSVDAAEYTCTGMTETSTAQDCMTAAGVSELPATTDVPAGHPHAWAWELQVSGTAAADQDPANMVLTSQSAFAWVATGCTGDCQDSTVHTVTNLTGALEIASGDCVYFDGVTPTFGDAWDDLSQSSRCFSADGTFTSGEFTITVGSSGTTTNGTTTGPIGEETKTDEESTPGFGLIAGVSAALGAALIVASRRED